MRLPLRTSRSSCRNRSNLCCKLTSANVDVLKAPVHYAFLRSSAAVLVLAAVSHAAVPVFAPAGASLRCPYGRHNHCYCAVYQASQLALLLNLSLRRPLSRSLSPLLAFLLFLPVTLPPVRIFSPLAVRCCFAVPGRTALSDARFAAAVISACGKERGSV